MSRIGNIPDSSRAEEYLADKSGNAIPIMGFLNSDSDSTFASALANAGTFSAAVTPGLYMIYLSPQLVTSPGIIDISLKIGATGTSARFTSTFGAPLVLILRLKKTSATSGPPPVDKSDISIILNASPTGASSGVYVNLIRLT